MAKGGRRPGAGAKKGQKHATTLEREHVLSSYRQRVMAKVDELFNSQFHKAKGAYQIFKRIEGDKGKVDYRLVTDPDEIIAVLSKGRGDDCEIDDTYYTIEKIPADNIAINSMLDRTFGKAAQSIEVKTDNDLQSLANRLAHILVTKHGFTPEKAAQTVATEYNLPTDQIVIESVQ